MENERSLDGYVLRSFVGGRHQARKTCSSQAACGSQAGGARRDIGASRPTLRADSPSGCSCQEHTGFCSNLGARASRHIELTHLR